jgi:predicted permease
LTITRSHIRVLPAPTTLNYQITADPVAEQYRQQQRLDFRDKANQSHHFNLTSYLLHHLATSKFTMFSLENPISLRLREQLASGAAGILQSRSLDQMPMLAAAANTTMDALKKHQLPPHASHPSFIHLAGLVSEAVLEVVFVALPGFLVAYTGMFDANSQKFVAELNTMVFTPCLIFTKLASQLNADKLSDLAVIPFIFVLQTLVSFACAQIMARVWGFGHKKMQKNFILAMGVFGNSNSLPISLVISLSKTIKGLHWDKVPGDNDNEVAARGILYLLIFQQLGQLLRWTWGYSVLLKPASAYEEEERIAGAESERETEEGRYRDEPDDPVDDSNGMNKSRTLDSGFNSGYQSSRSGSVSSDQSDNEPLIHATPANGNFVPANGKARALHSSHSEDSVQDGQMTTFPNFSRVSTSKSTQETNSWKTPFIQAWTSIASVFQRIGSTLSTFFSNLFRKLPHPMQKVLSTLHYYNKSFWAGVWRQMNPPLWAMLAALIVASVPALQHLFFDPGTLVANSVTRAVQQSGGVAVPLILVVLGANLARSTLPQDQLATTPEAKAEERKLLYASLLSRMILPTIIMAPMLALVAKFVPVSILDDPIFVIVCFLLTGAPSALQLAQICQINGVFMGAMSNLLTASYVVMIFPSTLVLVMLALEVVEWAAQS